MSLEHEDIATELAAISYDGRIESLPMKTLGKEEDHALLALAIWNDKNLLNLDLIRCFLLITRITGIKTGHVFANAKYLENICKKDNIAHASVHISCKMCLDNFNNAVRLIAHRECKIRLYSLRNKDCVVVIFANGDREDMCESSRHATALSCALCEKDMSTLLEIAHRTNINHTIFNLVPK